LLFVLSVAEDVDVGWVEERNPTFCGVCWVLMGNSATPVNVLADELDTLYYSVVANNYWQEKKIAYESQRLVNGVQRWIHPVQRLVN
jgi:hypothetical protein